MSSSSLDVEDEGDEAALLPSSSATFTFDSISYRNNTIYDSDMNVVYWIKSEGSNMFGTSPISIYRASKLEESRELVGSIEFNVIKHATVTYEGITKDLRDMFRKRTRFKTGRLMASPIGECKWSNNSGVPKLYDDSHRLLVSYSPNMYLFRKATPPTLAVATEATEFMDLVVIGWIITMHDLENQRGYNAPG